MQLRAFILDLLYEVTSIFSAAFPILLSDVRMEEILKRFCNDANIPHKTINCQLSFSYRFQLL